jgi:hypothetical protein
MRSDAKRKFFLPACVCQTFSLEKTETHATRTGTLERNQMNLSLPALIAAGPTAVVAGFD